MTPASPIPPPLPEGLRVVVCGGRAYADRRLLYVTLDRIHEQRGPIVLLAHGDSGSLDRWGQVTGGADKLAHVWATRRGIRVEPVPYKRALGRAGGPVRNREMLDLFSPQLVIAFPGKDGTADMVRQARARGIEVEEVPAC